jgi:hypothetical protein
MGEAVFEERIHLQAVLLDRLVADFAETVGPLLDPLQRRIYLLEEMQKLVALTNLAHGILQTLLSIRKLSMQYVQRG